MEDDAIRQFTKDFKRSGLLQELLRRQYFMTKAEIRKLKNHRAEARRRKEAVKKATRPKQTYNEKGRKW